MIGLCNNDRIIKDLSELIVLGMAEDGASGDKYSFINKPLSCDNVQ